MLLQKFSIFRTDVFENQNKPLGIFLMSQQKIWSYFQTETPEIFRGSGFRLYYLSRFIHPGQRVLNVGIGGCVFEKYARERAANIHTLDPDWTSLRSHATEGISHLVAGRLEDIPFSTGSFDTVVVSEVLEHLSPEVMQRALEEIRRVLIPGGQIIGTVPCEENLSDGMAVCPHCGEIFHKVGHLQSFDAKKMTSELGTYFEKPVCFERAFMAKSTVGWKELGIDLIRNFLVLTGLMTREKHLVFRGRKAV